jgi:HPt (histidine-containing phosphotransfer) domain-containing protein
MQLASEARDAEKFRAAAHSIKGGCGMVGAIELARIAADFERQGLPAVHTVVPFQQFLEASARLRGMLERVLDSRGDPIGGLSIP